MPGLDTDAGIRLGRAPSAPPRPGCRSSGGCRAGRGSTRSWAMAATASPSRGSPPRSSRPSSTAAATATRRFSRDETLATASEFRDPSRGRSTYRDEGTRVGHRDFLSEDASRASLGSGFATLTDASDDRCFASRAASVFIGRCGRHASCRIAVMRRPGAASSISGALMRAHPDHLRIDRLDRSGLRRPRGLSRRSPMGSRSPATGVERLSSKAGGPGPALDRPIAADRWYAMTIGFEGGDWPPAARSADVFDDGADQARASRSGGGIPIAAGSRRRSSCGSTAAISEVHCRRQPGDRSRRS